MKKETRLADFIVGVVFMALGVIWFLEANHMMKVELGIGPGDYPKFIAIGLFSLGLLQAARSAMKGLPLREIKINRKELLRLCIFVVVTFVYVRLMNYLGFILLTPFYVFFGCWFFAYRKYVIIVIASIVTTALIYLIFQEFFLVTLPEFRLF